MESIILEDALFLIITVYFIYPINTQEQKIRFSNNYFIHLEPNSKPEHLTLSEEAFFLIITYMYFILILLIFRSRG